MAHGLIVSAKAQVRKLDAIFGSKVARPFVWLLPVGFSSPQGPMFWVWYLVRASSVAAIILLFLLIYGNIVFRLLEKLKTVHSATDPESNKTALALYVAIIGASATTGFVWWKQWLLHKQTIVSRDNYYKNLLAKAIDMLGSVREDKEKTKTLPNIDVRIGGIHILERIAAESHQDHPYIIETLCAYIRQNGNLRSQLDTHVEDTNSKILVDAVPISSMPSRTREDVMAAFLAVGRRGQSVVHRHSENGISIDLSGLWIINASIKTMNFSGADLSGSSFINCTMSKVNLTGTMLKSVNLSGAEISECDLKKSKLDGIVVDKNSRLVDVDFGGATISNSDLSDIGYADIEFLESASGDSTVTMPKGHSRPSHWR